MSDNNLIQLEKVGQIVSNIGNKLLENNNLLKLIYYNESDALNKPNLTIHQIRDMIGKGSEPITQQKIYKYPFTNKISDIVKSELRFFVPNINPNNIYISDFYIHFQIVVHNSIIEIEDNKIRYWNIVSEILKSLNGFDCGGIGLLYLKSNITMQSWSDYYSGYCFNMYTRTV